MKFVVIYLLILLIHLLSVTGILPEESAWISKVLLMPVLLVMVATTSTGPRRTCRNALLIALALSWVGDALLIGEGQTYFGLGLSAFLLAHVAFIVSFKTARDDVHQIPLAQKYMLVTLGILVFGIAVFLKLKGGLGSMLIPVALYILVICVALIYAINRFGMASPNSFVQVFVGCLLFVVSDTLLALDTFHAWTFDNARFWVMLTYGLAQLFIALGIRRFWLDQA